MEYMINEGNKIGYMPTEFSTAGALIEEKIVAGAAITKGQLLALSDAMTVIPTAGDSAVVLGVAMFDAKDTEPVAVECEGLVKLTAAAAITAPAKLKSAAGGKVTPWLVATDSADEIVGIALNDASGDGKIVIARLTL